MPPVVRACVRACVVSTNSELQRMYGAFRQGGRGFCGCSLTFHVPGYVALRVGSMEVSMEYWSSSVKSEPSICFIPPPFSLPFPFPFSLVPVSCYVRR